MQTETNTRQVTLNELKKYAMHNFKTKRPMFVWGPPGIGKSETFEQIKNNFSINGIGKGFNWVIPSINLLLFIMTKTQKRNIGEKWSEEFNINAYDNVDVKSLNIARGSTGVFHEMVGTYWSSTLLKGTTPTHPLVYTYTRKISSTENRYDFDFISTSTPIQSNKMRPILLLKLV